MHVVETRVILWLIYPHWDGIRGISHRLALEVVMSTPAALVSLVEEHPAEQHLNRIVDKQSVLQFEWFAITHITWSGIEAEVQISAQYHEQRSRSIWEKPALWEIMKRWRELHQLWFDWDEIKVLPWYANPRALQKSWPSCQQWFVSRSVWPTYWQL